MRFLNCTYREFGEKFQNSDIVIVGAGNALQMLAKPFLLGLGILKNVKYIVDNNESLDQTQLGDRTIEVRRPDSLKGEKNVVVLMCSIKYSLELYQQLVSLELDDSMLVYNLRFIMAISCGTQDEQMKKLMNDANRPQLIDKTIHTFWFSGDELPDGYKKCLESWRKYCPDYEIKIWNDDTYDWKKNSFVRKAVEAKKWAFATDYARLDVLYNYGGIYMDLDVEVVKPLDPLLGNKAFFSFDMYNEVALETFGTTPKNELFLDIMKLYEKTEFEVGNQFLVQPRFIKQVVQDYGVCMNGNLQCVNGMFFASRNYFNSQDYVINAEYVRDDDSYTIHHANGVGWVDVSGRSKRMNNDIYLFSLLEN